MWQANCKLDTWKSASQHRQPPKYINVSQYGNVQRLKSSPYMNIITMYNNRAVVAIHIFDDPPAMYQSKYCTQYKPFANLVPSQKKKLNIY